MPSQSRLITKPNTIKIICTKKTKSTDLPKPSGSKIPIVPSLFESFWKIYPRHAGKGQALTAWNKICNKPSKERPTWRQIKMAVILQKKSEQWMYSEKQIAHPTTWLNQSRWLDDPKNMKPFIAEEEKQKPPKYFDGMRYVHCPDGKWRNGGGTGDVWID